MNGACIGRDRRRTAVMWRPVEKESSMKKSRKQMTALTLVLCMAMSGQVLAATVDYAPAQTSYERERTAEQWATLRDNVISWEELQDLVHEYNPTVSAMWLNYRNNENSGTYDLDYDDVLDAIEDTYSNSLGNGDISDASAEMTRSTSLAGIETTITNSDRQIVELTNQKSEHNMTEAIKQQIIAIYTSELTKELDQLTAEYNETKIGVAQRKLQAGTGTELDVLTAQKTAKDAEAALQSATAAATKARQTVLVNLGWNYDATPQICAVPEVTDEMIAAINLAQDTQTALQNNYQLQIDQRKLALAESDGTKNTTQITVTNDENQVQSNMTARYNAVLSAQNELRKAELNLQNMQTTLGRVTRSYAAGAASARDLEDAQYSASAAEYTVKLDRYALQSAYFSYLAGRDGLAGGSSAS